MDRRPRAGEFYRHFKNKLYQVVTIASHSETGEELVIYQALYGDYRVYARPLSMFVSEVDREKYPDAGQKYRFERVEMSDRDSAAKEGAWGIQAEQRAEAELKEEPKEELHPLLLLFIEAEELEEKLGILMQMRGKIGQKELDVIYVVLDMPPASGDVEEQTKAVESCLLMRKRYDGARLR